MTKFSLFILFLIIAQQTISIDPVANDRNKIVEISKILEFFAIHNQIAKYYFAPYYDDYDGDFGKLEE